ncbi:hypothetical protein VNO77_29704 [Canavalia gladiata]|uniref:Leucine-rich repeat-containing N-terminal plant-type domain-containing protein n=1 Tax=Canavalia gladiata TaxID=3824 RepID=A0AAN9KNR5_CANGL
MPLLFHIILSLYLLLFHFLSFSSSLQSLCLSDQSSALLQFKTSFIVNANYTSSVCHQSDPRTTTWENGTDCCSWLGVTCDLISGHVIGLDLSCSGLQGKLYPNNTLFHLTHIQTLNLAFNNFSKSQLPSQFGGFVSLMHLNLSSSYIDGEIPSHISYLSKLQSLDLSHNSLKWKETTWKRLLQNATALRDLVLDYTDMSLIRPLSLSSSLVTLSLVHTRLKGNLTIDFPCLPNLQQLYLSSNFYLEGPLPNLSCSTSLSILDVSSCQFQGSIPSSLLTLPHITFLYLNHNHLSGQIPNIFHQSSKFQVIDLSDNNIKGELPLSLSNLQNLLHLNLSFNKFSGQIPNAFGELTKLKILDLSGNSLEGQIPSSLFNLTQLSILKCYNNKLEGPLPNKITGFFNLVNLRLNNNLLNGTIPSWCLSLPSLVGLDLSNNHFTGHIDAISTYSLKILLLCNNQLQGNIPKSIFNLVNLTALCLSSNSWSGTVHFPLFSKLQNLEILSLSQNNQLSFNFESNINYSFSRLKILELSSNNLTEFPKLIGKFPSLSCLDMSNNKLNGKVPDWLHEMDSLHILNFSRNLLTTSINQFSRNYRLHVLDLSFNLLYGDISSICNISSLQILNLSNNKLIGIVPQCLVNLSSLQVLDLHMNKLYGSLPIIFQKNKLSDLNLSGNQLQSRLPTSLSKCTQLEILNLGNNQIEDAFPHWLHKLPNLRVLILRANKFHGPITSLNTKNLFPSLTILDISCNNFSGSLPTTYIKNLEAMKNTVELESDLQYVEFKYIMYGDKYYYYIPSYDSMAIMVKGINIIVTRIPTTFVTTDLSANNFEGEIPNVIGKLHALKGLNLSHNRLIGTIPRCLGNLTNLESLDLSSNMLIGGIPTELTNLNYLEVLNLSQNRLVGEIPQGKQFNTFSNGSYEGNLGLCGFPLSIKCDRNTGQHSSPSPNFWSEQKIGFGWKPVAIGYGCGMVFGMALGCCVVLKRKPQWLARIVESQPNKRAKRRARIRPHGRMND